MFFPIPNAAPCREIKFIHIFEGKDRGKRERNLLYRLYYVSYWKAKSNNFDRQMHQRCQKVNCLKLLCVLSFCSTEQSQHRIFNSAPPQHAVSLSLLHPPTEQWRWLGRRGSFYPYQHGASAVGSIRLPPPVP